MNKKVRELTCAKCKKQIWKSLESQRSQEINNRTSQPQNICGEGHWFDGTEAVDDAIKKSVEQFALGKNNLLIITPNMFALAGLMPAMDGGNGIKKLLMKYDPENLITCVLILEVSLPADSRRFTYTDVWISVKNKKPNL